MAAAAAGAAGNLGSDAIKTSARVWIDRMFENHRPAAIAKAHENADAFVNELAERVKRLEEGGHAEETLRAALEDPDLTATLATAVYGAARSNSRERHRVLANVVAERLKADSGGVRAAASNLAVEIVPRLAQIHLEWLGLLAVIYAIRADWLVPDETSATREDWNARAEAARQPIEGYVTWLHDQVNAYEGIGQFSDSVASSLASTSAIIFERTTRRDLQRTMAPALRARKDFHNTAFNSGLEMAVHRVAAVSWRGWLHDEWDARLQHARPTPAGLLIGCAVHDAKMGSNAASRWEWSDLQENEGAIIDDRVWDGKRIERGFMRQMEQELRDLVNRGANIFGKR